MSGLDSISIQVQPAAAVPLSTATAQAILSELETSLQALLASGREHSIDLRSLPLAPGELEYLKDALGEGEVRVEVDALGFSRVVETRIHGVWWVTHRNPLDDVMAEFIEVSFCPDIIRAQRDDVRESLEVLSARLAGDHDS
jgi:hydrogenase-1 operon protein HyaF